MVTTSILYMYMYIYHIYPIVPVPMDIQSECIFGVLKFCIAQVVTFSYTFTFT